MRRTQELSPTWTSARPIRLLAFTTTGSKLILHTSRADGRAEYELTQRLWIARPGAENSATQRVFKVGPICARNADKETAIATG